jgi:hypothetical protein
MLGARSFWCSYVSRDLGKQASISALIQRQESQCSNVIGLLEGSDPKLKEKVVVYTAHYDAYGIDKGSRFFLTLILQKASFIDQTITRSSNEGCLRSIWLEAHKVTLSRL